MVKDMDVMGCCAILCLVILGTLLLMGRDSALTTTFCGIAGGVFARGTAVGVWRTVKRWRIQVRGDAEGDGDSG